MGARGKHASATQSRRTAWDGIVWPLVTGLGSAAFTLEQFQEARAGSGVPAHSAARGLVSLVQKGVLVREGRVYSIHYRLIPYMRLGAGCGYATAVRETR